LLDDADLLVQEAMGGELKLMLGETLVSTNEDEASKYISIQLEDAKKDISRIKEDMSKCQEKMKNLKVILYSKFGTNINLEED
jgi:prefoldin subunit 4